MSLAEAEERLKDIQKTNTEILEALGKLDERKKRKQKNLDQGGDKLIIENNGNKDLQTTTEADNQAPAGREHDNTMEKEPLQNGQRADTIPLTHEMLDYSQLLRCKQTNDNRICDKFDIQPDHGIVGQSVNIGGRRTRLEKGNTKAPEKVDEERKSLDKRTHQAVKVSQNTTANEMQAFILQKQQDFLKSMDFSKMTDLQPDIQTVAASTKPAVGKPKPKAVQNAPAATQLKTTHTKTVRTTAGTVKSKPSSSEKRQKEIKSSKSEAKTATRGEGKKTVPVKVPSAEKKIQTPNVKPDTTLSARSSVAIPPTHTPNVVKKDSEQTWKVKGAPEEEEAEPVYINENTWSDIANQQIKNGETARIIRERGMDTIICLDLSDSMKGEPWKQATQFINGFIEGIQNSTLMDDVFEHVGLVTYGGENVVQQHMTCDYVEVKRKLHKLRPGGPSPLYAGFTMVYAAMNGAGSNFQAFGFKMCPRVFLLSDGQPTPANMIAGPDRCPPSDREREKSVVLELVASLHQRFHITVNVVPLGDFDMAFLERIVGLTSGKIIAPDDWEPQTRSFKNYLHACKVRALIDTDNPDLIRMAMGSVPESDKMEMEEFLKTHKKDATDSDSDSNEIPDLPALGARVKRNIFLSTQNEDVGTVTKHMGDGHIGVTWDKANSNGSEREKLIYCDGVKGVVLCDEPRALRDELIAVGCRVKRGKDWRYTDQDGGAGKLGSVFSVNLEGIVKVRWDNGKKNTYRYGQNGIYFDLEIVDERKKPVVIKTEQAKEPVDLIEQMNRRNTANSQSIMSSAPASVSSASESDSAVRDRERLANMKNSRNVLPRELEEQATKSVSDSIESCSAAEGKTEGRSVMGSGVEKDTSSAVGKQCEVVGDLGARPKAVLSPQEVQWSWNNNGVWQVYPPEICNKIETSFRRNPRGTALVKVGEKSYRIVFSRMEQVNVETKDKFPVNRK